MAITGSRLSAIWDTPLYLPSWLTGTGAGQRDQAGNALATTAMRFRPDSSLEETVYYKSHRDVVQWSRLMSRHSFDAEHTEIKPNVTQSED